MATTKKRMKRARYEVWRQGYTRDEGPEYAARCLECSAITGPWLCSAAMTKTEAWEKCAEHEMKAHAAQATDRKEPK